MSRTDRATNASRVRLQKFLSDAGVASRRHAEELMEAGRVLVNDEVVDTLPAFVDARRDRVVVDGVPVRVQKLEYWMLHKPKGFVSTNRDPQGRRRVLDLLPETAARVFPVGRLDVDSTGLLLLTNDGELSERLTHPRYGVPRVYHVEVRGRVPAEIVAQLRAGVHLSEGKAHASRVALLHTASDSSVLLVTLREGRNRQVRRMLARLGYPVKRLKRVEFGPLNLKGLPLGATRQLAPREVAELRKAAEEASTAKSKKPRRKRFGAPGGAPARRSEPESGLPQPRRREDEPRSDVKRRLIT